MSRKKEVDIEMVDENGNVDIENVDKISLKEIIKEAKEIIKVDKEVNKILYQLAFIITSDSPRKEQALRIVTILIKKGAITRAQYEKALKDVRRWRERVLDKVRYIEYAKDYANTEYDKEKELEERYRQGEDV